MIEGGKVPLSDNLAIEKLVCIRHRGSNLVEGGLRMRRHVR
jgi:hypothetical protein